jgi:predicted NUDIX family phosphoesterase
VPALFDSHLSLPARSALLEVGVTADKYNGERVLVVPTLLFHELGYFQGFSADVRPYLGTLLDGRHSLFLPRSAAEDDPSYKQLIPYCLFRCGDQLLHYRRGSGVGEGRLLGKRSVGIGGHISEEDAGGSDHPYQAGMRREIAEEVEVASACRESILGLINDDATEVGRVHLGVVHVFDLDEPRVTPRESSIAEVGFARPDVLAANADEFETWSQICLRHLIHSAATA